MPRNTELDFNPEVAILQNAFQRLSPDRKGEAVGSIMDNVIWNPGYRTTDSGVYAVPVEGVRKDLPAMFAKALIGVLSSQDRKFVDAPYHIDPSIAVPSIEWHDYLNTCLAAIPKDEMVSDLTGYIRILYGMGYERLARKAVGSVLLIAEQNKDRPLDVRSHLTVRKKIISEFLDRTTNEYQPEQVFSRIKYSIPDFMTGYLCKFDVNKHEFTIEGHRLDVIRNTPPRYSDR